METETPASAASTTGFTPRRPTRGRVGVVAILFFGLLLLSSLVTVAISGDSIEADLKGQAERAVEGLPNPTGGTWKISFDGRDGQVSGEIFESQLWDGITGRIRALPGVRVLDDKELGFRPMETPWLEVGVRSKEKAFSVRGLLPANGDWKSKVLKALRGLDVPAPTGEDAGSNVLEDWRVDDRVEVKADVFDPTWSGGLGGLALVLAANPRAEALAIREGRATLDGAVFSNEARDALSIAADAAFRESGLVIDNRFRVVEPPMPPKLALDWTAEGIVTLGGKVGDIEAKQRLESAIAEALPPVERFTSKLMVGENTGDAPWEEAVGLLVPGLVSETKVGSLSLEETRVRISGEMDSEEMREALQEMAIQSFPDDAGYQFDIALTVHIPPRPAIMSVIHMAEAGVKLKGVVGSEATREAFVALARGQLPAGVLLDTEQIEVERNTMEPSWMPAFVAVLPGFVENTTRGGLTVYENSLVIEAEVPTEVKWDAVWQLSENLFPDPDFTRDVQLKVVDPSLPPQEDLGPEDPDALGAPD